MTEVAPTTYADFTIPPSVVSRIDLSRLVSEVERVDGELTAEAVRAGEKTVTSSGVGVSSALTDFLSQNNLSLNDSTARSSLIKQLRLLKNKAPVIHMTFASTADQESLQELVAWVRSEVHQQAVISVGLQPDLVAGVYVRTPNHVHDLTLKAKLEGQRELLLKELEVSGARR